MLSENESKIRSLLGSEPLADRVLEIISEDEAMRHADLVRRQSEGLKNARERGVRLGRPPAKRPRKFQSIYTMYQAGEISARAASQMLHVSPGTFKRWTLEEEESAR
jgi:DNA invertase Pin-like site-specific DNA recombinase